MNGEVERGLEQICGQIVVKNFVTVNFTFNDFLQKCGEMWKIKTVI